MYSIGIIAMDRAGMAEIVMESYATMLNPSHHSKLDKHKLK